MGKTAGERQRLPAELSQLNLNAGDIRARYNISKNTDGKWIIATRDTLMTTRPSTLGTPRGHMAEDLYDTADQALSRPGKTLKKE